MQQRFWNQCFDKGRLKNFVLWFFANYGESKTVELLENLKNIGFEYATKAGLSLGIDDLKIPPKKKKLIVDAEKLTKATLNQYKRGEITGVERFQRLIDTWHRTSETLKQEVIDHFKMTDILNPVYMMAFSGARGNISQVRQLVGMRGLMADPQGQILDFPIRSNFREGLTLTEYIISCYGARKGIVDTALRTANAGYLTRRLVDVAQHVLVALFDCETKRGIVLTDMKEGKKTIYSLTTRLIGRVLAQPVGKIGFRNQEISPDLAITLAKSQQRVFVRSPLTCESNQVVCQLCYGWSLSQGNIVSIGEVVGIIAAQSIGEPGTQLTMRTFHTGGIFSGDVTEQIKAPFNGIAKYPRAIPGTLIRTSEGNIAFLTKNEGIISVEYNLSMPPFPSPQGEGEASTMEREDLPSAPQSLSPPSGGTIKEVKSYKIPPFTVLFVRNGEYVFSKQVVAQISNIAKNQFKKNEVERCIKTEIDGEVYFANLKMNELVTVIRCKPSQLMKTRDTALAKALEQGAEGPTKSENWTSGSVLSGKVYKTPIPALFFPKEGDFIGKTKSTDKKGILNGIKWLSNKPGKNCTLPRWGGRKGWDETESPASGPNPSLPLTGKGRGAAGNQSVSQGASDGVQKSLKSGGLPVGGGATPPPIGGVVLTGTAEYKLLEVSGIRLQHFRYKKTGYVFRSLKKDMFFMAAGLGSGCEYFNTNGLRLNSFERKTAISMKHLFCSRPCVSVNTFSPEYSSDFSKKRNAYEDRVLSEFSKKRSYLYLKGRNLKDFNRSVGYPQVSKNPGRFNSCQFLLEWFPRDFALKNSGFVFQPLLLRSFRTPLKGADGQYQSFIKWAASPAPAPLRGSDTAREGEQRSITERSYGKNQLEQLEQKEGDPASPPLHEKENRIFHLKSSRTLFGETIKEGPGYLMAFLTRPRSPAEKRYPEGKDAFDNLFIKKSQPIIPLKNSSFYNKLYEYHFLSFHSFSWKSRSYAPDTNFFTLDSQSFIGEDRATSTPVGTTGAELTEYAQKKKFPSYGDSFKLVPGPIFFVYEKIFKITNKVGINRWVYGRSIQIQNDEIILINRQGKKKQEAEPRFSSWEQPLHISLSPKILSHSSPPPPGLLRSYPSLAVSLPRRGAGARKIKPKGSVASEKKEKKEENGILYPPRWIQKQARFPYGNSLISLKKGENPNLVWVKLNLGKRVIGPLHKCPPTTFFHTSLKTCSILDQDFGNRKKIHAGSVTQRVADGKRNRKRTSDNSSPEHSSDFSKKRRGVNMDYSVLLNRKSVCPHFIDSSQTITTQIRKKKSWYYLQNRILTHFRWVRSNDRTPFINLSVSPASPVPIVEGIGKGRRRKTGGGFLSSVGGVADAQGEGEESPLLPVGGLPVGGGATPPPLGGVEQLHSFSSKSRSYAPDNSDNHKKILLPGQRFLDDINFATNLVYIECHSYKESEFIPAASHSGALFPCGEKTFIPCISDAEHSSDFSKKRNKRIGRVREREGINTPFRNKSLFPHGEKRSSRRWRSAPPREGEKKRKGKRLPASLGKEKRSIYPPIGGVGGEVPYMQRRGRGTQPIVSLLNYLYGQGQTSLSLKDKVVHSPAEMRSVSVEHILLPRGAEGLERSTREGGGTRVVGQELGLYTSSIPSIGTFVKSTGQPSFYLLKWYKNKNCRFDNFFMTVKQQSFIETFSLEQIKVLLLTGPVSEMRTTPPIGGGVAPPPTGRPPQGPAASHSGALFPCGEKTFIPCISDAEHSSDFSKKSNKRNEKKGILLLEPVRFSAKNYIPPRLTDRLWFHSLLYSTTGGGGGEAESKTDFFPSAYYSKSIFLLNPSIEYTIDKYSGANISIKFIKTLLPKQLQQPFHSFFCYQKLHKSFYATSFKSEQYLRRSTWSRHRNGVKLAPLLSPLGGLPVGGGATPPPIGGVDVWYKQLKGRNLSSNSAGGAKHHCFYPQTKSLQLSLSAINDIASCQKKLKSFLHFRFLHSFPYRKPRVKSKQPLKKYREFFKGNIPCQTANGLFSREYTSFSKTDLDFGRRTAPLGGKLTPIRIYPCALKLAYKSMWNAGLEEVENNRNVQNLGTTLVLTKPIIKKKYNNPRVKRGFSIFFSAGSRLAAKREGFSYIRLAASPAPFDREDEQNQKSAASGSPEKSRALPCASSMQRGKVEIRTEYLTPLSGGGVTPPRFLGSVTGENLSFTSPFKESTYPQVVSTVAPPVPFLFFETSELCSPFGEASKMQGEEPTFTPLSGGREGGNKRKEEGLAYRRLSPPTDTFLPPRFATPSLPMREREPLEDRRTFTSTMPPLPPAGRGREGTHKQLSNSMTERVEGLRYPYENYHIISENLRFHFHFLTTSVFTCLVLENHITERLTVPLKPVKGGDSPSALGENGEKDYPPYRGGGRSAATENCNSMDFKHAVNSLRGTAKPRHSGLPSDSLPLSESQQEEYSQNTQFSQKGSYHLLGIQKSLVAFLLRHSLPTVCNTINDYLCVYTTISLNLTPLLISFFSYKNPLPSSYSPFERRSTNNPYRGQLGHLEPPTWKECEEDRISRRKLAHPLQGEPVGFSSQMEISCYSSVITSVRDRVSFDCCFIGYPNKDQFPAFAVPPLPLKGLGSLPPGGREGALPVASHSGALFPCGEKTFPFMNKRSVYSISRRIFSTSNLLSCQTQITPSTFSSIQKRILTSTLFKNLTSRFDRNRSDHEFIFTNGMVLARTCFMSPFEGEILKTTKSESLILTKADQISFYHTPLSGGSVTPPIKSSVEPQRTEEPRSLFTTKKRSIASPIIIMTQTWDNTKRKTNKIYRKALGMVLGPPEKQRNLQINSFTPPKLLPFRGVIPLKTTEENSSASRWESEAAAMNRQLYLGDSLVYGDLIGNTFYNPSSRRLVNAASSIRVYPYLDKAQATSLSGGVVTPPPAASHSGALFPCGEKTFIPCISDAEHSSDFSKKRNKRSKESNHSVSVTLRDQRLAEYAVTTPGQIIHLNNKKVTLRRTQPILLSPNALLHSFNGAFVEKNTPLITLPFQVLTTGDIVQGIPKIEQFFEARTTKNGRMFKESMPYLLTALYERYKKILPIDQAVRQSFYKIQQIIIDGVQRVYRSQGVTIADKHIEIIVKQMTSKVLVLKRGQTGFLPGEILELEFVEKVNASIVKKIRYEPIILGITRASLEVDSFLSAASFQQTTKVLSKAAISKKRDFLKGLKENVIVGNIIPAGTAYIKNLPRDRS